MSSIRSVSPNSFVAEPQVDQINVQIFVPCFNIQKCIQVNLDDTVWSVKQNILADLPKDLQEGFNYGLFLPPCNGRAGKFLLEDRPFRDYPFHDCVPYLEMKYKKRVYKSLTVNEKLLAQLHTKTSLKRFLEWVEKREAKKIEDLCSLGLDPNFHNAKGETPLTLAACVDNNRSVIMALVAGGAHLDFRNLEGQTPLHRAVFLSSHQNVKTLLDLGSSPNSRDPLGLTPLYYAMLRPNTSPNTAELLLRDYADIAVVDPHGNQEIHQACKNGLVPHLEHLLYYGAEINCQNINGNTPLHICAVNNQMSCARVLLFRNADSQIVNNQGQTAYHVAVITGHTEIAELLKNHDPDKSVPYRAQPRYNSKRRLTWSRSCVGRRKSLSLSQSDYGSLRRLPSCSASENPSPALSRANLPLGSRTISSEYRPGLMHAVKKAMSETGSNYSNYSNGLGQRKLSLEQGQPSKLKKSYVSDEVNVPRILVIPRGPNGFGFILRGAKKLTDAVNFEPTSETPALQYFEDIDPDGMAIKGGLKPNDFLLEINGIDVRCYNHDQVVELIHSCENTITLKVITVALPQPINGTTNYGTLRQVKRASSKPCPRGSYSSLSLATGRLYTPKFTKSSDTASLILNNDNSDCLPPHPPKNGDYLPSAYRDPRNKVASIRSRPQSRRISASELEQLMSRQNCNDNVSMTASMDGENATATLQNPKVYTSVSEMKRLKQQKIGNGKCDTDYEPDTFQIVSPPQMKSFNSSPNLQTSSNLENGQVYANRCDYDRGSSISLQRKKITRPKTPPPPPPPPPPPTTTNGRREFDDDEHVSNYDKTPFFDRNYEKRLDRNYERNLDRCYERSLERAARSCSSPSRPLKKTNGCLSLYQKKLSMTPPPYDTVGANGNGRLRARYEERSADEIIDDDDNDVTNIQIPSPNEDVGDLSNHKLCITVKRSITPDKFMISPRNANGCELSSMENGNDKLVVTRTNSQSLSRLDFNFNSDLQNAIAKRRTLLDGVANGHRQSPVPQTNVVRAVPNSSSKDSTRGENSNGMINNTNNDDNGHGKLIVNRTESVLRERNGVSPPKTPSSDYTKKDSGYASSRNSLERNDFSEDSLQRHGYTNESLERDFYARQRTPALNSNQLDDSISRPKDAHQVSVNNDKSSPKRTVTTTATRISSEQDSMSVSSTLSSLSACSSDPVAEMNARGFGHQQLSQKPSDPPPDYDEEDSGNAESDVDEKHLNSAQQNFSFKTKPLMSWTVNDVCRWLDSIYLSEYKRNFARSLVDGCKLMNCGRAQFAQLGVTRIAHRLAMENSLKTFNRPVNY